MRQTIILTGLLILIGLGAFCQEKATRNFTISGRVLDAQSKQPIEFTTIALLKDTSKKPVDGTITDKKGVFALKNIPSGLYRINVTSLGYREVTIQRNVVQDFTIGDILLQSESKQIGDVTVTARKQVIDYKLDKTIYNVEKDITSQGGGATDALRKIPGVTVDADGNVELLGNPSIRFLIDGRPSVMFGNSAADALRSIPASQIQSIEVITNPSAKYDASGTGGIINIILKKNNLEGINGNISIAVGTRLENGNLNLAYKKKRLSLNTYFSGNAQLKAGTPTGSNRITTDHRSRYLQESLTDMRRNGYKTGLGIDWALSATETISLTAGLDHFGSASFGLTNERLVKYDVSGNQVSDMASLRNATNQLNVTDFENSLSYKKQFRKKGEELEFVYDASFGQNKTYYNQLQADLSGNVFAGSNSLNPGKENEVNFEFNYVRPLKNEIEIETGLRTTLQSIISNADIFTLNATTGNFMSDTAQSYASNYHRTVYAGYVSLHVPLSDAFEFKAGARYEYTISKADYSNAHNVAIPDYSNVAPSLLIAYQFNKYQMVKLGYSYRIERPDFRDLNPFMNLADPHNITTGNPALKTEIGNKVELSYNTSFRSGSSLNIIAYYQRNSPDIKPYITYYPTLKIGDTLYTDVTLTTRETIAAEVRAGVNIAGTLALGKKLTLRPNIQLFTRHLRSPGQTPEITDGFGTRSTLNVTWQATKTLYFEAFGNYNVGMHWQGRQADNYSYSIALRKQFWNNKAGLGFVAVNPFNKYVRQHSEQSTSQFIAYNYKFVPYRSLGLSFTYRFGKLKSKTKEADNFNYTPPAE
jgi:ferric enterobactin receptor